MNKKERLEKHSKDFKERFGEDTVNGTVDEFFRHEKKYDGLCVTAKIKMADGCYAFSMSIQDDRVHPIMQKRLDKNNVCVKFYVGNTILVCFA